MSEVYEELRRHFAGIPGVEVAGGRGAQGIKVGGKMRVMFHKGQVLARFSPERAAALIAEGRALPHDPGTGRPMKDRVLLPVERRDEWIPLCEESLGVRGRDSATG